MSENQLTPIQIETLTFDSFARNREADIVCVAPIRTIIRREEEIVLIRRVRKVEEIDASPACPTNTTQVGKESESGVLLVYANVPPLDSRVSRLSNPWGKTVSVKIEAQGKWNYGKTPVHNDGVDGDGHRDGDARNLHFPSLPNGSPIPPAALVAVVNGKAVGCGKKQTITLQPGETVYFLNNDELPYYKDNDGELKVYWSIN